MPDLPKGLGCRYPLNAGLITVTGHIIGIHYLFSSVAPHEGQP